MPRARRVLPLWRQVADHYKSQILTGVLREGDRLPSIRQIREEWDVSQSVAQQAVAHLHLAERLVRTEAGGTFVAAPRAVLGPQQRMRLAAAPAGETVTVTAAGIVPAPEYVVTLLGLPARDATVIRREEVTRRADGVPYMLSVTWCSPWFAGVAAELVQARPLADPHGAAHLIAQRSGWEVNELDGGIAFECRLAKDDGRELDALGLMPGAYVLAVVSGWRHEGEMLAYTEFILPPDRVVEFDVDAG